MAAILTLLVTLTATLLITRIATVALMVTGLSREAAKFQARSALSGVGFTSVETEKVMNHPVRRRIISILMLVGNVGFVTVMATLFASLVTSHAQEQFVANMSVLVLGLVVIWIMSMSSWIDRRLSRIIYWALKTYTRLDVSDYVSLLHVSSGYGVLELQINSGDWLDSQSLAQTNLSKEGVLVLGIQREDGTYLGAPTAETRLHAGDVLIVYCATDRLRELDARQAGDEGTRAHRRAVNAQQRIIQKQLLIDKSTNAEQESAV